MKKLKFIGIGLMLVLVGCGEVEKENPAGKESVEIEAYKQADYPESFVVLGDDYAKDNDGNVYYWNKIIEEADFDTFEVLQYDYAIDKNNVYFKKELIVGADPKTFQVLDYPYAKDDDSVYFIHGSRVERMLKTGKFNIKKADAPSFEVLGFLLAKDENNCFSHDQIAPMSECEKTEKHYQN